MRSLVMFVALLSCSVAMMAQAPAAAPLPVLDAAHQATPEQVREYFALIHLDDALKTMTTQVVRSSRANSAPFIPTDFWDDMTKTFNQYDIVAEYVPVYQKLLSKEDMAGILAFYRTDAGKHMIAMEPTLRGESQQHFQTLAKKLGQEVEARHKDEIMAAKKKYDDEHQGGAPSLMAPAAPKPTVTTPAVPPASVPKS